MSTSVRSFALSGMEGFLANVEVNVLAGPPRRPWSVWVTLPFRRQPTVLNRTASLSFHGAKSSTI